MCLLWLSVDDDTDAESQIILPRPWNDERRAHCLKRRWRQDYARLLITTCDDVPIDLAGSNVETMIEPDIDSTTERHREAGLVDGSKHRGCGTEAAEALKRSTGVVYHPPDFTIDVRQHSPLVLFAVLADGFVQRALDSKHDKFPFLRRNRLSKSPSP